MESFHSFTHPQPYIHIFHHLHSDVSELGLSLLIFRIKSWTNKQVNCKSQLKLNYFVDNHELFRSQCQIVSCSIRSQGKRRTKIHHSFWTNTNAKSYDEIYKSYYYLHHKHRISSFMTTFNAPNEGERVNPPKGTPLMNGNALVVGPRNLPLTPFLNQPFKIRP